MLNKGCQGRVKGLVRKGRGSEKRKQTACKLHVAVLVQSTPAQEIASFRRRYSNGKRLGIQCSLRVYMYVYNVQQCTMLNLAIRRLSVRKPWNWKMFWHLLWDEDCLEAYMQVKSGIWSSFGKEYENVISDFSVWDRKKNWFGWCSHGL